MLSKSRGMQLYWLWPTHTVCLLLYCALLVYLGARSLRVALAKACIQFRFFPLWTCKFCLFHPAVFLQLLSANVLPPSRKRLQTQLHLICLSFLLVPGAPFLSSVLALVSHFAFGEARASRKPPARRASPGRGPGRACGGSGALGALARCPFPGSVFREEPKWTPQMHVGARCKSRGSPHAQVWLCAMQTTGDTQKQNKTRKGPQKETLPEP